MRPSSIVPLLRAAAGAALAPLLLVLAGCASPPPPPAAAPTALFADDRFGPPTHPIDPGAVFAVDDAMRSYLRGRVMPEARAKGTRQALLEDLYRRSGLKLEYESTLTRNASEAFAARSGNCLSLVIMTAALARELGLGFTLNTVIGETLWSRSGDMHFLNGHVNVSLGRRMADPAWRSDEQAQWTVDFLPAPARAHEHLQPVSEQTVIAMYMNNRAAELLADEQVADAYWHARQALVSAPDFLPAYNTLGVVYLRHGDAAMAETALRLAVARDPDNLHVQVNLAQALRATGQFAEAAALMARVDRIEPNPPFHFFYLGQRAMQQQDWATAREMFRREIARSPDYHEFHYWLAVADVHLGRMDEAEKEIAIALEDSTRKEDHALYAAKRDRIKALEARPVPAPAL